VVEVVDGLEFEKMQGVDHIDYGVSLQRWPVVWHMRQDPMDKHVLRHDQEIAAGDVGVGFLMIFGTSNASKVD
jgi:hypothetical protein